MCCGVVSLQTENALQVYRLAEQPAAADAFQRPLRSRFQARLSRSVMHKSPESLATQSAGSEFLL
jgi:hypothetical protein